MSNQDKELDENYDADLISLLDDEGNEYEFEILDEIDYKDSHYFALMPMFDLPEEGIDSESTYMIFEEVYDDDDEAPQLAEVDDENLLDEIAAIFEAHFDENMVDDEFDEDFEKE